MLQDYIALNRVCLSLKTNTIVKMLEAAACMLN